MHSCISLSQLHGPTCTVRYNIIIFACRLYPWGNAFHSHKHHPSLHPSPGHNPPDLTPSIFTSSPHHSTIVGLGGSTLRMGGGREGEAEKNMREGKKGRKKKHVRYAQVARSNFLQVGNTYGAPPRTAPPAGGLRGVANSLGNHHHANQSTVNVVTNRSEAQPTNVCTVHYCSTCTTTFFILSALDEHVHVLVYTQFCANKHCLGYL